MIKLTASQERFQNNAVSIAAIHLIFATLQQHYPCPNLSDIVTIHNGQGLVAANRDETGDCDVYAAGGLVGKHSECLSDQPFVVIGRKGSAGKPTFAPAGGWVIDTAYYAQPNDPSQLDCKFLFYAISSLNFRDDIITTAIPGINRTAIYRHSIPVPPKDIQLAATYFLDEVVEGTPGSKLPILPSPLTEQRRIVARIEELATKIEEARGLRRQAAEEAQNIFDLILTESLSQIDKIYWKSIGECAKLINGRAFKPHEWSESGMPIVRIQNLNDASAPFNHYAFDVDERFLINSGDLLLSWSGTPGTSFGCYIWNRGPAILNQHIFKVLLDKQLITKKFFRYAINHKLQEMIAQAHGAVGLQHITKGKLEAILIPVPPPSLQMKIVAYLDSVEVKVAALKHLQAKTTVELDALLPSVLDKAFKGEL